jgi:thioredoxin-like negative regulator of GroEL
MDRYLKRLEQDPDDHKAMYDLAIKYVEAGDIDKADQLADQIKKYDESMAGGLRNLIKTIRRKEK